VLTTHAMIALWVAHAAVLATALHFHAPSGHICIFLPIPR
jgi:hypothetical protein